jgi:hypothetical protein
MLGHILLRCKAEVNLKRMTESILEEVLKYKEGSMDTCL